MFISLSLPFLLALGAIWLGKKNWSDQDKIEKVLEVLEVKEGDKVRKFKLLRKDPISGDIGCEYVYKIPLKVSMDDIERLYPKIRDGINVKREGKQFRSKEKYSG